MDIQKMGRWASLLSLATPFIAFAQASGVTVPIQSLPNSVTSIPELLGKICTVGNIMFTVLLVVAIIYIILAAYNYLFAAGETEKITEANHQILYSAIAVAIAVFAKVVPLVVGGFFTNNAVNGVC